jgi:restriction endonuclease S subunit
MYMKLKDIASVMVGYTFREAIIPEKNGNIFVFQAKDLVRGEFMTDVTSLKLIALDTVSYNGYLKKGDVLIVARGMKAGVFRSTIFKSDASNVVASSSVHVIRITTPSILPEYISYYLNSKKGQNSLSEIVTGSYIGVLPRRSLEQLNIPIPNLRKQRAIVGLHQNIQTQQKIQYRQNELKQQVIEAALTNITRQYDQKIHSGRTQ